MDLGLVIVSIFLGACFIGGVVYLIILTFRKEEDLKNENLIVNFMPQFSNGYAVGTEVETIKVNNRFLITFKPRDIDNIHNPELENVEFVQVVADENKMVSLPMGDLSNKRNLKIILPPHPEDFPSGFKKNWFGAEVMKLLENIDAENTAVHVLRKRVEVEDKLLMKVDGGERMEEYLDHDKELVEKLYEKAIEKVTEKKPESVWRPPSYGTGGP